MRFHPLSLALFLALGSLAACRGSVRVFAAPPSPTPLHFESEPNDWAPDANFVATLAPPAHLIVRGDLEAELGDVDGFAFRSAVPVTVEFTLGAHDPHADLDLCLYDPVLDEFVATYRSIGGEKGRFHVPQGARDFHLVVYTERFDCGSPYDLELAVFAGPHTAADDPTRPAPLIPAAASLDGARLAPPRTLARYAGRGDARGDRPDPARAVASGRARTVALPAVALERDAAGRTRLVQGVVVATRE